MSSWPDPVSWDHEGSRKPLEVRLKETLDFSLQFPWEAGVRNLPVVLTNAHTETNRISVECHAYIPEGFSYCYTRKVQTITCCQLEYTHDASGFQVLKISISSTVPIFLDRSHMCIVSHVSQTKRTSTTKVSFYSTFPGHRGHQARSTGG